MVDEFVVLFEGGPRLGKESVVSFTFTLSLCFAYLLLRLVGWVIRWVSCFGHICEGGWETVDHIV